MKDKRATIIISVLLVIIVLLVGFILYSFLIKPQINGYVVEKQIEAQDMVFLGILSQVQQNGYVQIAYGNQSLILVPYVPPQNGS